MELMDYDDGMNAINWEVMNKRDYSDQDCKCVCMAECLAPGPVTADLFHAIYVKDDEAQKHVRELINGRYRALYVDVMPAMFSK